MDMEDVVQEMEQRPKWSFRGREKEGWREWLSVVGKKLYQCLRRGMRSLSVNFLGGCCGLKWFNTNENREDITWSAQLMSTSSEP